MNELGDRHQCRKELILHWCTGANARLWESSRLHCSETAGHRGPLGVKTCQ